MLVRSKKISVTSEELDTIIAGETDNGVVDTLPEVFEYIRNGGGGGGGTTGDTSDMTAITSDEINFICG